MIARTIGLRTIGLFVLGCLAALALGSIRPVAAQTDSPLSFPDSLGPGALGGPSGQGEQVQFSGEYKLEEGTRHGTLYVKARIEPTWHVYSLTQPPGGPVASKLTVPSSEKVSSVGEFTADRDPEIHFYNDIWPDLPVEEHPTEVIWTAPVELKETADPQQTTIQVVFNGQVCKTDGVCIPLDDIPVEAEFTGYYEPLQASGEHRTERGKVTIQGHLEPQVATPGGTVQLKLTAVPDDKWHIYELQPRESEAAANKPTLIVLTKKGNWTSSAPKASRAPVVPKNSEELPYYEEPVTWTVELQVPEGAKPGQYPLAGLIGYQTCLAQSCLPPSAAEFQGTMTVGTSRVEGEVPLAFSESNYATAAKLATEVAPSEAPVEPLDAASLAIALSLGLLGGLILNLMPCVLPVIGLKILAFVEQASESRARIFALNVWFSLGLFSVFLILATLAAFMNLSWGQQFTLNWFKISLIGLVFAMALSFLGTWEIPIPGFVGAGASNKLQQKEGVAGAFSKGVFTTILATPCSGPFLGTLFGYTLSQPPYVTYLIFGSVALGMASPYLLIGAFPGLIQYLPKPGAWMETFKQFMGFVLLGTVVFLFTTISADYFIPTLTLLVGIWFGCWLIGRTPLTAEFSRRLRAWTGAIAVATVVGVAAFLFLGPHDEVLPWKPYTPERVTELRAEGKTVMVDFTANWCLTCKLNLKTAINTSAVQKVVEENEVVPLLADWTDRNDTIKKALAELGANSIPLLAIYPADPEKEPIILRDLVVQSQVIEALQKAGPSNQTEAVENGSVAATTPTLR